eukprot:scaffold2601_cov117-Isochrysis_galbana.AAC.6
MGGAAEGRRVRAAGVVAVGAGMPHRVPSLGRVKGSRCHRRWSRSRRRCGAQRQVRQRRRESGAQHHRRGLAREQGRVGRRPLARLDHVAAHDILLFFASLLGVRRPRFQPTRSELRLGFLVEAILLFRRYVHGDGATAPTA